MSRKKSRAPHSADTRGGGFAGIPICVINSEAYRQLDVFARAVLVEIVARMRGHNNGRITISYVELASRLNRRNQGVIGRAIASLIAHGLVDLSAESVWKERRAREYRLTFVNTTDGIGRSVPATNDYLRWDVDKSDATGAVVQKSKSVTPFVAAKIAAAAASVAAATENKGLSRALPASDAVVPIDNPYLDPTPPRRSHTNEFRFPDGTTDAIEQGAAAPPPFPAPDGSCDWTPQRVQLELHAYRTAKNNTPT